MTISSRSFLSPARVGAARDPPPLFLSNSHNHRLKNSRSIKGGASPAMFPTIGKKRGSSFESPKPSSPKVTCIFQVRMKSKKKHTKNLSLSRRQSADEVSFRRFEHSGNGFGSQSQNLGSNQECLPLQRNNQRWFHLPLMICEGLRAFGSEGGDGSGRDASGGGERVVELIVGDNDDENEEIDEMGIMNSRRHVFQDLEIVNDIIFGTID
ncbi:unnamed protein product [Lactuca saligna]|uniref:Uncharacterized protein n=1 Tax=Lactuca saligna TaxID=75948 RepID=A0AA36E3P9_LACSI|nr:unnamed protein product [Lactuca saligna]